MCENPEARTTETHTSAINVVLSALTDVGGMQKDHCQSRNRVFQSTLAFVIFADLYAHIDIRGVCWWAWEALALSRIRVPNLRVSICRIA